MEGFPSFNSSALRQRDVPIASPPPGCALACAEAVVTNAGSNATEIFGSPDDLKLRSSATLLASVSAPDSVFHRLLEKFYLDGPDKETLRLLGISNFSWRFAIRPRSSRATGQPPSGPNTPGLRKVGEGIVSEAIEPAGLSGSK